MGNITISDYISMLSIAVSTLVSIVSIYYSHKAVKIASNANQLTAKITAEANRPIIVAYLDTIEINEFHKYLVIKNFGNTSATILDLKFSKDIDELGFNMSSLIDYTIAPSQKFMHILDNEFKQNVIVNIIYQDHTGETYDEIYQIKTDATSKLLWIGSADSNRNYKLLKNSAEAVIKALK
ncbi:TPA: hypothetical protein VB230_001161 [Streptococcus pyogenes]|uniref:hypothetical protein n=1 Tax=Streptococcus TaxID=1301 RepID=UPI0001E107CB|nr:hypothetical protein [Streptococcus pyogenes]EFM32706.1 hypothetical protein HMPREF0841_1685 [Streptococcus pyogenes ATCC 10782]SQE37862.1 Uncharacterised protein [Streptococcus pyogenes]SQF43795.1 Uncharacterised protein [Streptococcus pyogenes]SQF58593.1 Uncharacterised protein [Streptococcus pyogenes]SUO51238.1 Uncharacterised protein [Streptococcus pyogenes]